NFADMDVDFASAGTTGLQDIKGQSRITVYLIFAAQVGGAEFGTGNILEVKHRAVGIGLDDNLFELLGQRKPTLAAKYGFEGLIGSFAEFTGSNFEILVADGIAYVLWHQAIGSHFFGVEPCADGIVARPHPTYFTDAIYSCKLPHEVDLCVRLQESFVVQGVGMVAEDVNGHDDAALARFHRDARLDDFGRDARTGFRYPRLHIYRCLVGVRPRFKKHRDITRSGVGG